MHYLSLGLESEHNRNLREYRSGFRPDVIFAIKRTYIILCAWMNKVLPYEVNPASLALRTMFQNPGRPYHPFKEYLKIIYTMNRIRLGMATNGNFEIINEILQELPAGHFIKLRINRNKRSEFYDIGMSVQRIPIIIDASIQGQSRVNHLALEVTDVIDGVDPDDLVLYYPPNQLPSDDRDNDFYEDPDDWRF